MNGEELNMDFCCTCLKVNVDHDEIFVRLAYAPLEEISYLAKLKICVPEIGLENTNDCMLCQACSVALENAYTFRCMCLHNENKLEQFRLSKSQNGEAIKKHIKVELMEEETSMEREKVNIQPEEFNVVPEVKYFIEEQPTNSFLGACFAKPIEYSADNYMDSEEGGINDDSIDIDDASTTSYPSVVPEKSRKQYEVRYNSFKRWSEMKNITCITEGVILAYFMERSQALKSPANLWSEYSMLKTTIFVYDNVDISKYKKLVAYLKGKNKGYQPKKSKIFTFSKDDIDRFLLEAPDSAYLMMKVVMIMAVAGGLRNQELCNMTVDDIEDKHSVLVVKIPDCNTKVRRTFTIINREDQKINLIEIYRQYAHLRPRNTEHRRFFLQYQAGKCGNQGVGINAFSKIPTKIAEFLNLNNPEYYTGRSFRRTSTTFMSTGIDMLSKI